MSARPAPAFRTITDADWAAMFRAHRALGHYHGNSILANIRRARREKFPAAGSAGREGGGPPRAEAGGGDPLSGSLPFNKANERGGACENSAEISK